ncbi:hypothetical protein LXL04_019792 [Taraxacum kok-saghyz]
MLPLQPQMHLIANGSVGLCIIALLVKDLPESDMGGFTRVLHSGSSDNLIFQLLLLILFLMGSIGQTFYLFISLLIFQGCKSQGYVVLNRPWACVQWLERATIEEEYILMAEPDHIFANPLPNLAHGDHPAGFPFFYIKPAENKKVMRKYYPMEKGPVTNIDLIGNSPL